MAQEPPPCRSIHRWLKHHLGKNCFAPLTGQDFAALSVFVHAVDLYSRSDGEGRACALDAMRASVQAMQPSVRPLAKRSIPMVLDWADEDRLWNEITRRDVAFYGTKEQATEAP